MVSNDIWRQRLYQLRQGGLQIVVNLNQWWQNIFADSWQSLESLFGNSALSFSIRKTATEKKTAPVIRAKSLNLPNGEALLLVGLDAEIDGRTSIRIQLRSRSQEKYLPTEIHLKLLSSSGELMQSIQARSQDNIMQLKQFKSPAGTQFRIQIEIDNFVLVENFVI